MTTVSVRTMTQLEFDEWQDELATEYAAEQIAAGRWPAEGAVERARAENVKLLPDGPATARMLTLRGLDADGRPVGRAWVGLDHPRGAPGIAFLYDIEVLESRRRLGYGRALLDAVEAAATRAGAAALELNVFGANGGAIGLYSHAGYEVVTQQMRKSLHCSEAAAAFAVRASPLPVTEFAFPGPVRDALNAAILTGEKTSTTSLLADYEAVGEELPRVGQAYRLIDSVGLPIAIVEVTEVRVVRLGDVDLQHAIDEGEGFTTVAQWRDVHEGFWTGPEYREVWSEHALDDDTPVVLERFGVVETPEVRS